MFPGPIYSSNCVFLHIIFYLSVTKALFIAREETSYLFVKQF